MSLKDSVDTITIWLTKISSIAFGAVVIILEIGALVALLSWLVDTYPHPY